MSSRMRREYTRRLTSEAKFKVKMWLAVLLSNAEARLGKRGERSVDDPGASPAEQRVQPQQRDADPVRCGHGSRQRVVSAAKVCEVCKGPVPHWACCCEDCAEQETLPGREEIACSCGLCSLCNGYDLPTGTNPVAARAATIAATILVVAFGRWAP
jgi:hypothetical protein